MKKNILLNAFFMALPLFCYAQSDDVYFIPKADKTNKVLKNRVMREYEEPAYYSGSNRDVDEYNRRGRSWTHYQELGEDKKGQKIVSLRKGMGTYPDSMYLDTTYVENYSVLDNDDEDFRLTRRMRRFYNYYDPYWDVYDYVWDGYWTSSWGGRYGYYNPWYRGYYAYPYSYAWHNPYYYGRPYGYYRAGWYSPYGYYGWGGYYGYAPRVYVFNVGHAGTLRYYDRSNYRTNSYGGAYRSSTYSGSGRNRSYTPSNMRSFGGNSSNSSRSYNNSSFGGSSFESTRSGGSFRSNGGFSSGGFSGGSVSGGSFGGSRPSSGGSGFTGGGRR